MPGSEPTEHQIMFSHLIPDRDGIQPVQVQITLRDLITLLQLCQIQANKLSRVIVNEENLFQIRDRSVTECSTRRNREAARPVVVPLELLFHYRAAAPFAELRERLARFDLCISRD